MEELSSRPQHSPAPGQEPSLQQSGGSGDERTTIKKYYPNQIIFDLRIE
jgi:hypothetical protein